MGHFSHLRQCAHCRPAKGSLSVMQCFGSATYYHVKEQLRAITEEEQQNIRNAFIINGYDGKSIEFDYYEEHYPTLMRMKRYK